MKLPIKSSKNDKNTSKLGAIAITNEPTFAFTLTPQLELDLAKARKALMKNKKDVVVELKKMIQKYPHVNTFYNFLALAYQDQNKSKEEYELIKATIKKFPNYFFARINLLSHYVSTQNITELDKLLENVDSIQDFAPQKETFHISEVSSFYSAFLDYLALKSETKKIKEIWKLLETLAQKYEELDEKMPTIKMRFSRLFHLSIIQKTQKRMSTIVKVEATSTSSIQPILNVKPPTLHHDELADFLSEGFYNVTQEQIDEIASLPRKTLIEDFRAILIDIQTRKQYVYSDEDDDKIPYNAVYHILNFVSLLNIKEIIPLVLDVFRQDKDFLDFWLGEDIDISYLVWLFYKFFEDDFSTVANFVKEENNSNSITMGMMSIPAQVVLHNPNRRQEAIDFYKDLIQFYIENKNNKNITDHYVISHLGQLVTNIEGKELQQELIELDKVGLINGVINPIEDILKELDTPFHSVFQSEKVNLTIPLIKAYNLIYNQKGFNYPRTEEEDKKSKEKSKELFKDATEDMNFFDIGDRMDSFLGMENPEEARNSKANAAHNQLQNQYEEDDYEEKASSFNSYMKNKTTYQRNDKVTVRYKNGKIIENTKYKKVEKDIKEGKCFIV